MVIAVEGVGPYSLLLLLFCLFGATKYRSTHYSALFLSDAEVSGAFQTTPTAGASVLRGLRGLLRLGVGLVVLTADHSILVTTSFLLLVGRPDPSSVRSLLVAMPLLLVAS